MSRRVSWGRVFDRIGWVWNWKAAVTSAGCRALLFFLANLPAGYDAAWHAWRVELAYRLIASGFYGGITERLAGWSSARLATMTALLLLPALAHTVEYLVHVEAGTARVGIAVLVSIGFSMLTTAFNLFAMRRGLLVTASGKSLGEDLAQLARVVAGSVASGFRSMVRLAWDLSR